jgi:hypothetical protein
VPLTPQQLADFQRLRQSYAPVLEAQRRKQQAQANLEKMHGLPPVKPQPKAGGGSTSDGLKRFLAESSVKHRLYHGTSSDVRAFKPSTKGALGHGIYLTDEPDAAGKFAERASVENRKTGSSQNIMPVHVSARRMLDVDMAKPHEINALIKSVPKNAKELEGFGYPKYDGLTREMIDNELGKFANELMQKRKFDPQALAKIIGDQDPHTFRKIMNHAGFDGMTRISQNLENREPYREYTVFYPHQIKSAIGNRGTYDTTKDDLNMAKGGSVMGINVASDRKAGIHYADLIVDGKKTIETRNSDTLRPYVGKRVAIVRTGAGPAKAIGEVTIGEPMVANKSKFRAMQSKHMVPEGSMFDITTPTKHLYPLHSPVRYDDERDVGHGIVSRKVIHEAKGGSVEPKKTVKAYKLFRVHPDHPGKLFPLFVDANTPVEMNKWTDAKEGEMANGKVKSKIGALAYRPGWHAGDLPIATHIGEKSDPKLTAPDRRPANHAWAEVEMPDDVDWQSEATKRGTNAQGKVIPVKSHITDQIPKGGHYRYKTNPNMTGNWLIGGSMKVNKVLTDAEVKSINKAAGMSDLPRAQPFKKKSFGFAGGGCVGPQEWMAEEHVNYKARGGRVTHAHHLEIEERPL